MKEDQASATALLTGQARACHQLMDYPTVFDDPLATAVIGTRALQACVNHPPEALDIICTKGRAAIVARSRVAEDALCEAVGRGVMQYVVLGAGLDTFAYRNPYALLGLKVFEVDHPATQAWKRRKLSEAGIAEPAQLTFVPVDFATQTLPEAMASAGFRADSPAFFSWLGVTMYLLPAKVMQTLGYIASLPRGSGVAFDFMYRPSRWNLPMWLMLTVLSRRYARMGEPWVGFLEPRQLVEQMRKLGFSKQSHLTRQEMNRMLFSRRDDDLRIRVERLGGMMVATV